MSRGEGTPLSAHDLHSPKRLILREERAFYRGDDILKRDPAQAAQEEWRLNNQFIETHPLRMPHYPTPGRRRTTKAHEK